MGADDAPVRERSGCVLTDFRVVLDISFRHCLLKESYNKNPNSWPRAASRSRAVQTFRGLP